jgi:hypothetical protein
MAIFEITISKAAITARYKGGFQNRVLNDAEAKLYSRTCLGTVLFWMCPEKLPNDVRAA